MAGFKGYKRSIVLDFNYDEVKKGIPDVNKQMALLDAEFRKSSEEIKSTGSQLDKLGLQHEKLSNQLKLQGDKVKILREELVKLESTEGNNEKAITRKNIELKKAEAQYSRVQNELKKTSDELDKQAKKLGLTSEQWTKLSEKTKKVGKSMTTYVTAPIVAAGAAIFKFGADATETMNKVDVVFNDNSEAMKNWAENSLEVMGMASSTALDMAAKYGDMSNSMGLSSKKTLEYSQGVTRLAADLASFKNISIDVADTALTAIWTGETESLKGLGIVMTQTNLQRFASSKGIQKNIEDMTEAEKVQLRYEYIMKKTSDAQGDFARTGESASNQMRTLPEALKQLGESFNEFVEPMILPFIKFLNNMIEGFAKLSDGTKAVIVGVAAFAAVIGPVLLVVSSIASVIANVGGAMKTLNTIGSLFNSTTGNATFITFVKWAGIIIAVVAAITALIVAFNYLIGRGDKMNEGISKISEAMGSTKSTMQSQLSNTGRRAYAIGTQYHKGGRALVGEYGPEEVWLPEGASVKTARDTRRNKEQSATDNSKVEALLSQIISRMDKIEAGIEDQPRKQQQLLRMGVI